MGCGVSTGQEGAHSDVHELGHRRISTDDDTILDDDMTTENGTGCQCAVVSDLAIVTDMGVGHEEVFGSDSGGFVGLAPMGGEAFPERVFIPDDNARFRLFGIESEILRRSSDPGAWKEHVSMPDFTMAMNPVLAHEPGAGLDSNRSRDDAMRADDDIVVHLDVTIDDGGRVDGVKLWHACHPIMVN